MNKLQDWEQLITVFMERNAKINLSAIRSPEDIFVKHIIDSLEVQQLDSVKEFLVNQIKTAVDIGTWWWFPLLPLAKMYPDIQWTWLDARKKKIDAINDMSKTLWMNNCYAIHTRIENHTNKYDLVTARAVTYADTLLDWTDTVLKPGWIAIFYKLLTPEEDAVIQDFWRDILEKHLYTLSDADKNQRVLYVLKKPS